MLGLALAVIGGALNGSFALPMKFAARWPWEAIWLVYSVVGFVVLPPLIALASLPGLWDVYAETSARSVALVSLFGFGWGVGSVLFGIGIRRVGVSLGFSIILGLTAALGSLVPMVVLAPAELLTPKGAAVLLGLGIVLVGILLCGAASGANAAGAEATAGGRRLGGILICVAAGILSSMLNLSIAFGGEVASHAVAHGASASAASNAIWVLAILAGATANVGYSAYLLTRNRTWASFAARGTGGHWFLGTAMGTLWMAGISVYGSGSALLGGGGAVIGWPLFIAADIVAANAVGVATGEWRGAPARARNLMLSGVAVLILAAFVVAYGSTL
jgi:L-rhamnose-H+ transport protein